MSAIEMTCIRCPIGCRLTASVGGGEASVTGHACKRGLEYAIQEMTSPMRVVTTSVRVVGGEDPICSVKTDGAVPKDAIFRVLRELRAAAIEAPVRMGQVIAENVAGTGVRAVATSIVDYGTATRDFDRGGIR